MVSLNYRKDHVVKNKYSRSGDPLIKVQAIVVHYTANPHANAEDHQKYFDGSDGGGSRYAGAHIFVDKDEAVEIIPLNEVGYHANDRTLRLSALKASTSYYPGGNANLLTIGIEMCIEKNGSFHPDTVERTRLVIKYLQDKYPQLRDTQNRVVRHYDVTGKICPKPFVEDEQKWNAFLYSIDQPVKTQAKPVEKPKEEVKIVENAIIINSEKDYTNAVLLQYKLDCALYTTKETFIKSGDKVKNLYVVGGNKDGLKADKIILISGDDRNKTSIALDKYL